jgi:hypothetical protein
VAQNKIIRVGPTALTNAAANLLNPNATSGGVGMGTPNLYILIKHIRIVNKTGVAHNFQLFIGATGGSAAGTEYMGSSKVVPANDAIDLYDTPGTRLDVADFLTGLADANTALTFQATCEVGVA